MPGMKGLGHLKKRNYLNIPGQKRIEPGKKRPQQGPRAVPVGILSQRMNPPVSATGPHYLYRMRQQPGQGLLYLCGDRGDTCLPLPARIPPAIISYPYQIPHERRSKGRNTVMPITFSRRSR